MNKTTTNFSILLKTLFVIIIVVITTATALIGIGGFKAVYTQQLPRPGLAISTEVKPQPKTTATSLPEDNSKAS